MKTAIAWPALLAVLVCSCLAEDDGAPPAPDVPRFGFDPERLAQCGYCQEASGFCVAEDSELGGTFADARWQQCPATTLTDTGSTGCVLDDDVQRCVSPAEGCYSDCGVEQFGPRCLWDVLVLCTDGERCLCRADVFWGYPVECTARTAAVERDGEMWDTVTCP